MTRFLPFLLGLTISIASSAQLSHAITFFDDFNDGNADGWIFVSRDGRVSDAASSWKIEDEMLVEYSGYDAQMALVSVSPFSSQTLETEVYPHPWGGVVLWYQDLNNFIFMGGGGGGHMYLYEVENGIFTLAFYDFHGLQSYSDFRVEADSEAGTIDVYMGGEHAFTHNVQTGIRNGLSGLIGGNGGGHFDNFTVTSNDTPTLSCTGFEDPMNKGPISIKNSRVLPLKAGLLKDNAPVTDADISAPPVIQVTFAPDPVSSATDVSAYALSAGQRGNYFVYTTDGTWQFNLSTKNYSTPGIYTISIISGDGSEYSIEPTCTATFEISRKH